MFRLFTFTILIFFLATSQLVGQRFLVLEKMGTKKRHEFHLDDVLIFQMDGEKIYRTDEVIGFGDSTIVFSSGAVNINHLSKISLSNRKKAFKYVGGMLITAGVGYFALDQFNKVIRGDGAYIESQVVRTSAILTGIGLGMIVLSKKKVSLKKKNWRLRLVDMRAL